MKIAFITAGAAGMYCGSCMKDNTLVAALARLGHDALLIPTYTPIRTDEEDVSQGRVFFGGINVYLQQKSGCSATRPWLLDRLLDFPRLLRWVSRFAVKTQADQLGDLTVSMLQGESRQAAEGGQEAGPLAGRPTSGRTWSSSPTSSCPAWCRQLEADWGGPVLGHAPGGRHLPGGPARPRPAAVRSS